MKAMFVIFRPTAVLLVLLLNLVARSGAQTRRGSPGKTTTDVIVFVNGDRLSGTLERGVGDTIVFKSDMTGESTVPLSKIKELHSSGSFAVLRKDQPLTRTAVTPGTISYADGEITVANPAGVPATVPVQQLSFVIDQATYDKELARKAGPLTGWNGNIAAGATVVRSTQNGTTFNTAVTLVRLIPTVSYLPSRNRTTFDLSESYGTLRQPVIPQTAPPSPDTVAKTNILHTDLERDEYLSPKFYALAQLAYDHNYSQGLDLQQIYGGGFGWTVFEKPTQQLDLKADVHYEKQQFETASNNANLIGSTFSEAYRRNFPRKVLLTETINLIPAWNDLNAYAANGSLGLAIPVFKRCNVSFTTTDSFINNPSAGFQKNSFQFVTAVGYSLH